MQLNPDAVQDNTETEMSTSPMAHNSTLLSFRERNKAEEKNRRKMIQNRKMRTMMRT